MSKKDREKLRKAKARKDKRAQATKAARAEAKMSEADATTRKQDKNVATHPLSVDSVGRSIGGGGGAAPRLPRRSKKG